MVEYSISTPRIIPALGIAGELGCDVVFRTRIGPERYLPWLETNMTSDERYRKLCLIYGEENVRKHIMS